MSAIAQRNLVWLRSIASGAGNYLLITILFCLFMWSLQTGNLLLLLLTGIVELILAAAIAVTLIVALLGRNFRQASRAIAALLLLFLLVQLRMPVVLYLNLAKLYFTSDYYLSQIKRDGSRFRSFPWTESGGSFGSSTVVTRLVYDESDEISREESNRTESWKEAVQKEEPWIFASECRWGAHALRLHFYIVSFNCD